MSQVIPPTPQEMTEEISRELPVFPLILTGILYAFRRYALPKIASRKRGK